MLSLIRALVLTSSFCAFLLTGCAQNGQGGAPSISPNPTGGNTGTRTLGDPGILQGTINGGGGRGIRCKINGVETFESLDLFEAKSIGLKLRQAPATEDAAIDLAIDLLAKHLWTPGTVALPRYSAFLKKAMRTKWLAKVRFLDGSKSLRMIDDSHEVILQEGCKAEQIAVYYEASILVNRKLYDQLDNLGKAALWLHEITYYMERSHGRTDSISTRLLVGQMLSEKGAKSRIEGLPKDKEKIVNCVIHDKDDNPVGGAFVHETEIETVKGTEFIFKYLPNTTAIMRTSAFFDQLDFKILGNPVADYHDSASLEVDLLDEDRTVRINAEKGQWEITLQSSKTGKSEKMKLSCHVSDEQLYGKTAKPKRKELPPGPPSIPKEVELKSRYEGVGTYETTATYSFRYMTHDVEVTRNNWDILLEARKDFKNDYLSVNMVADDDSFIWALPSGASGCAKIDRCEVERYRQMAKDKTGNGISRREDTMADVKDGQCYLVVGQDGAGQITALFEVKDSVKSVSTKIHNIKVLDTPIDKSCK